MIMGHKLLLDDMFKNISEYILKQPFIWDQLFVDVFKLSGKRKIDYDSVYRVVIGINGEGLYFDRKDPYIAKAEYVARKLGGSLMYRAKELIELNIPSGLKNGSSVYNFDVVALEKYRTSIFWYFKFLFETSQWLEL